HLVGIAFARVLHQLLTQRSRKDQALYHQTLSRTVSWASSSDAPQTPRLRYFQPPSANRQTISPRSSVLATRKAACSTAAEEMPANTPSWLARRRVMISASSEVTRIFRSSTDESSTGGMKPSSRLRNP